LIDHLTTQRQIQTLVSALNQHVVTLIKDLNGNHVIQKCLNSLKPEDNQFIYNAVAASCVEVATHRHGCCVMQRCIDHASESQRIQLVTEITYHCLTLVQVSDPTTSIVGLSNGSGPLLELRRPVLPRVRSPLRRSHHPAVPWECLRLELPQVQLERHRKGARCLIKPTERFLCLTQCIRVSDPEGRRALIQEILERGRLERLVKDLYANYVVQTACDYAEPTQRDALIQQIRPLLPTIRNVSSGQLSIDVGSQTIQTPYGKRIAARIQKSTPLGGQRFVSYPMSGGFAYPGGAMGYGQAPGLPDPSYQPRGFNDNAFFTPGNYGAPGPGFAPEHLHNPPPPPPVSYSPFM
jgi:hypothetical protein